LLTDLSKDLHFSTPKYEGPKVFQGWARCIFLAWAAGTRPVSEEGLGRPEQLGVKTQLLSRGCALYRCSFKYMGLLQTCSYRTSDLYTPRSTLIFTTLLESPPYRTMVTLQLFDLPDELLIIILSSLPTSSILACKVSCRRLRAVIEGSEVFQWRMWSTKHGIQELLPSGLSLPDFFAKAQQWENDWFRFGVGNEVAERSMYRPFQGSRGCGWPELCSNKCHFLLRSGYLIQMRRKENPGWSHMQLSPLRELRGFISDPVWTDVRLGDHLTMEGWALDLDQDLVAASLLS